MTTITTLPGLPSDYTFRGGVARHRNGSATAIMGYDELRFSAATWRIVGDKPVPTFAMPGCAAVAPIAPAAEHPLLAKLRAAGVDVDRLAAALKP